MIFATRRKRTSGCRLDATRYWKGVKPNNEPLFPQNDLLRGEHEQKLGKSEKRERVEVLLELERFDKESKSLKKRVRSLKLRRKLLLERLNQVVERN